MEISLNDEPNALPNRIRRFVIISGYAFGVLHLVMNSIVMLAWGYPFRQLAAGNLSQAAPRLLFAAPVLLLIGIGGFQLCQRWASTTLYSYAVAWIVGTTALHAANYLLTANSLGSLSNFHPTLSQKITTAIGQFEPLIYECMYPVILVLCLRTPELTCMYSNHRRGFALVTASDDCPRYVKPTVNEEQKQRNSL